MQHFMVTENVLFSAAESNSCSLYFVTADGKADRSVWVWHCFPVCCTQLWKVFNCMNIPVMSSCHTCTKNVMFSARRHFTDHNHYRSFCEVNYYYV